MIYVGNNNKKTKNIMNIIKDPDKLEAGLLKDIDEFKSDPNFKLRIVSQSSKQAMSTNEDLNRRYPDLKINILTGSDSGATKKEYFDDINKTLDK